jgi:hypothetical protein
VLALPLVLVLVLSLVLPLVLSLVLPLVLRRPCPLHVAQCVTARLSLGKRIRLSPLWTSTF